MTESVDERQDRIDGEAAAWVIRQGGTPLTVEEQRAFATWRAASRDHEEAFRRASALWSDLDVGTRQKRVTRRRQIGTGVALGVVCLAVLTMQGDGGWLSLDRWRADYTTATGEIRTVSLPDGSTAQLDSHTALAIHYGNAERRIVLIDGDAWFRVAPLGATEHRPFVVEARHGTSTALGTQFMVEREHDSVRTTVTEHSVRVVTRTPDGLTHSVVVAEGQSVRYDLDGSLETPQAAPVEAMTAWRSGQLVFDNAALSDVIARLNRYRRGRIMLMGARLRDRRVSGVFSCSDIDGAVSSITRQLAVRSVSVAGLATIIY
ncbi:FecR family protein [Acetobacter sp.]|uniref:FecR family protein n=1 Tax=Acetobacter sp. TaxID=440 RepID=UPI0039E8773B